MRQTWTVMEVDHEARLPLLVELVCSFSVFGRYRAVLVRRLPLQTSNRLWRASFLLVMKVI